MISCAEFRATFAPATEDPNLLEHLRGCDACLGFAADADPDVLFRAIGGAEMIPPGGVDAFAADVMREVRLRSKENVVRMPARSWRSLAAAAAISVVVFGGSVFYERQSAGPAGPLAIQRAVLRPVNVAVKPVVERYESDSATIVEVPTVGSEDVQVVMVFDESLPADL